MTYTDSTVKAYGREKEDLTPEELVARAKGLRELLRSRAAEAEVLGRYTEDVHEALLETGLYHLLTPKRYGGYEFDIETLLRVVIALAEGDPGVAWNYALGHGHVLGTAAFWPEHVQEQAFRNPRGYFKAGHSLRPAGTATPVEGGYMIKARSDFQSGISYGTHATVYVELVGAGEERPVSLDVLVPESEFEILDNWGTEHVLGLGASGSNSVVVDNKFVEAGWAHRNLDDPDPTDAEAVPGLKLHGNPQYLASPGFFQSAVINAVMIGAARAAVEEYERLAHSKKSAYVPMPPRFKDDIYQRDFWMGLQKTESAEVIMRTTARNYQERVRAYVEDGVKFDLKDNLLMAGMSVESGQLAADAVDLLFRSVGASETARGKLFEKLHRDTWTYRSHAFANYGACAAVARTAHRQGAEMSTGRRRGKQPRSSGKTSTNASAPPGAWRGEAAPDGTAAAACECASGAACADAPMGSDSPRKRRRGQLAARARGFAAAEACGPPGPAVSTRQQGCRH